MIVEFDKSFDKSLKRISDKKVLSKLKDIIIELEESSTILQVTNIVKLTGYKKYYRIRIGDYRLGIELIDEEKIRLILVAHRKEIYRKFP